MLTRFLTVPAFSIMKRLVGLCVLGAVVIVINSQEKDHVAFCAGFLGCSECLSATNSTFGSGNVCYWCKSTNNGSNDVCLAYTASLPIEVQGECPNLNYNVGTCALTALIIILLPAAGVLFLSIVCCSVGCLIIYCHYNWRGCFMWQNYQPM